MCTAAYADVHAKLAMKVGKRAQLEDFTPTTWEDFGREIGVGAPFVRRRAGALAELTRTRLPTAIDGIASAGFDGPELEQIADVIRARADRVLDLGAARPAARGG
jgi:serine/threonine-protein kinase HipA